jgi:hypothetical protein
MGTYAILAAFGIVRSETVTILLSWQTSCRNSKMKPMYLIIQPFQVIRFLTFSTLFFQRHFSVTFTNSNKLYLKITIFFIHFLWCSEVAIQFIFFQIISFIFHFNCNTLFLEVIHVYKTFYYSFQIIHCLFLCSQYIFHYKNIFLSMYFIILYISIYIYISLLYISTYIYINISNYISLICGNFHYLF